MKRFERIRLAVFAAVVALIVIGLVASVPAGTWSALGLDFIALLCPVGALSTLLGGKQLFVHMVLLLGLTVFLVVMVGKAFCAWVCPVPWTQRFFRPRKERAEKGKPHLLNHKQMERDDTERLSELSAEGSDAECSTELSAAEKTSEASDSSAFSGCGNSASCARCALSPVGGARDGLHLDTRHFVLGGALGSAALFGFPVFCLVCPIGLTAALVAGLVHLFSAGETSWGLLIFPVLILLEVVFFRKWCVKICPVSALLSLVSSFNVTFKPQVKTNQCLRTQGVDCHACTDACPEKLDPHSSFIPECSKCGACVDACPAKAIKIKPFGK